jgi:predicted  nucleic acid-binding Zn-ribbon protein
MTDDEIQQPAPGVGFGHRAWVRGVALAGGGLVAGGILAGTLSADAATDTAAAATSSTRQEAPAATGDPSQPQRSDEQLLTGDTATTVTDAALAKYPDATIQRVETDSDGVYEAHIVTADGQQVVVGVDEDSSVTGTQAH